MIWRWWPNRAAFDVWHDAVCVALGIPHPNRNVATGEIDPDAQWTTAYTDAVEQDGVWALVEDDVAALVPDGLGLPGEGPQVVDGTIVPPEPDGQLDDGEQELL
jgi:hypothetical protein